MPPHSWSMELQMGLPETAVRFDRAVYFEWEDKQVEKNEFLAGEVFAMVGARQEHVVVAGTLFARFREHLQGTRCRAYVLDMKLEVDAADAVFYPDVMVSCDEADRQRSIALRSPCLIVEVLSDTTAAFDRGVKFAAYRQLASLQEYLLVDIDRRRLELFRREPVGWVLHEPAGLPGATKGPLQVPGRIPQGAARSYPSDPQGDPLVLELTSIGLALTAVDAFADLDEAAAESAGNA